MNTLDDIDAVCPINWLSPQAKGLLAAWPMAGGWCSGSRVIDAVNPATHGNHGALSGQPVWYGDSIRLDGTDDVASFGNVTGVNGRSQLSAFAWIRMTVQDGRTSSVLHKFDSATARWSLSPSQATIGDDNDVLVLMGNGANSYGYTTSNCIPLGLWTHIGFSFDGLQADNASRLKIFVNSRQMPVTFASTIPATTATTTGALKLGYYESVNYFPGYVKDIRIYQRALQPADICNIYANPSDLFNRVSDDDAINTLSTGNRRRRLLLAA